MSKHLTLDPQEFMGRTGVATTYTWSCNPTCDWGKLCKVRLGDENPGQNPFPGSLGSWLG